jgi:NADH-quinone oxidoreductase subunit N
MSSMGTDVLMLLPEALLLLTAICCLLLGSWTPRLEQQRVRALAAVGVGASLVASIVGLTEGERSAFSGTVAVDDATGVLRLVVGLALLVLLLLAGDEIAEQARESEIYVLLLLGGAGALVVGETTDLAVLVVGFLLASIPLYALIGLSTGEKAPEAALKTYLLGALAGILLMLGAAVLSALAGGTSYDALGDADGLVTAPVVAVAAGVVLVLTGLLFKAGAVPAHLWVPDAVEGSWTTTGAFLTTVPKLGAVLAIARLLEALPPDRLWPVLVGALAASGMTIGNLGALNQAHVGRLLGWSTISQVGYLMAAAAAVPGSAQARPALLLFLAGYAVTNLGCFAVLASEPERRSLDDWRGMGRTRPGLITSLGVGLLGLVGTPPTAVFVAKLLTIVVTWEAGLPWLAVLVAANTVLSLTYYLRWLASCLSSPTRGAPGQADSGASHPGQETRHPRAAQVAVACAVAAVVLGLLAGPALALAS